MVIHCKLCVTLQTILVVRYEIFTAVRIQVLLGCDAMYSCGRIPTFQKSMLPHSSRVKSLCHNSE